MSSEDIKNDPCVKDFVRSRTLRKTTQDAYLRRIRKYCNFIGKTPIELIEEAEKEEEDGIKPRKRKIRGYILDYVEHLENKDLAQLSIKTDLETINTFYHSFDIDTPKVKRKPANMTNLTWEAIPETKHLKEAQKYASVRQKAIMLLMFSSGMGLSEVRYLDYSHFIDAMEEYLNLDEDDLINVKKVVRQIRDCKNPIGTWRIERFKTGMPYITFNSPESTNAILDYLLHRGKKNKQVKNLSDPLFASHFNLRMSKTAYLGVFQRLNDSCNFGWAKGRKKRFLTSHGLRKLFTTTLYNHGVDKLAVDWFLGHRINPVTEAYFKSNVKDLKMRYMNVVDRLTLSEVKVKNVTTKEYDQLLKELRQKGEEYRKLEKRLEILEQFLGDKGVQSELNKR